MTLLSLLTTGLRDVKRDLIFVLVASLVTGILFSGLALLVDWMIFRLLTGEKFVVTAIVLLLTGLAAYALLEAGRQIALYRLKIQLTMTQQNALYQHLLKLPLSVYRSQDTTWLAQTAFEMSSTLAGHTLQLLCIIVEILPLFILLCLWIPSAMLVSMAVIAGLTVVLLPMLAAQGWQYTRSYRAFHTLTRQIIQSVAKLRVSNTLQTLIPYWTQRQQHHESHFRHAGRSQSFVRMLLSVCPAVIVMIVSQANIAAGFVAWLFFSRLVNALYVAVDLSGRWGDYRDFLAKTRTGAPVTSAAAPDLNGDIVLENVVFRYQPSSEPVLNGVSLHVRAGQRAAIVGVSGAGKSTLLRLLAGIDAPESGSIRYDGCDLREIDGLSHQIGVVLQESKISVGSIWSNINGFTRYPIEAAWVAAQKAEIAGVVDRLVMKMHTIVDEHATVLSRGQAQRLLLARALVHQPRILLLDDATNAIDDETVTKIFANLAGNTVIITAQRLTTLQHMDVIFVLHEGRIVEQGSYAELTGQNGVFAQLVRRQLI